MRVKSNCAWYTLAGWLLSWLDFSCSSNVVGDEAFFPYSFYYSLGRLSLEAEVLMPSLYGSLYGHFQHIQYIYQFG